MLISRKVTEIQQQLIDKGFLKEKDRTGKLDPVTRNAIKLFQATVPGLIVDGIVGWETGKYLFDELIRPTTDNDPLVKVTYPRDREGELKAFYGEPGSNQVTCRPAYPLTLAWDKDTIIRGFSCHTRVKEPLEKIFKQTLARYGNEGIRDLGLDMFGGCLNIRPKKGSQKIMSLHSWGAAVDLDPENNQYKWDASKARFAQPVYDDFWRIVEQNGGKSLGRTKDYDYMHFQFTR